MSIAPFLLAEFAEFFFRGFHVNFYDLKLILQKYALAMRRRDIQLGHEYL
jgi:hypothetical protein